MQCNHKSFDELIWGAPGTGKTRMLSVLLWTLLQLKCRTLACAPTNVAITEVASRVLKLEKESFETADGRDVTFCCLGNILLFGKKNQIKVGSSIEEIYLDYRVEKLAECFGPLNGWKHCFNSMIEFLEGCVSQYQNFCLNEKINDKEPINRNGNVKVEHNSFLEFMKHCF
ncbi:uncharacterized protein LOC132304579 [Cornus florida]|uniref:uncharacterized protein LOC132304579 n=1 Tax=Cornus florida TaxID=4283 RepID=UPI002898D347|nr:uncharacterized protein LOC132304579 [Cornus florida]